MKLRPTFRPGAGIGKLSRKHSSTGIRKDTCQLTACETSRARAVPKPSLMILLAATGSKSVQVTEVGSQPDVELAESIENPVIAGVNDHGSLRPDPQI